MIAVTERAKDALGILIAENAPTPEAALRLTYSGPNELTLTFDTEKPGDYVVEHNESKVLLVDDELSPQVAGLTMDIDESPSGTALRIRPSEDYRKNGVTCSILPWKSTLDKLLLIEFVPPKGRTIQVR